MFFARAVQPSCFPAQFEQETSEMRLQRLASLVIFSLVAGIGCDNDSGSSKSPSSSSPSPSSTATSPAPSSSAPSSSAPSSSTAATPAPQPSKDTVAEVKDGWGSLKGKFIYDGSPPEPSPLTITKDREVCGKLNLVDESIVVNKENQGLANVVVFLYLKRGQDPPQSHESYAETADARVELDNKQCRFEPHVCLLRTSQTLVIKNSDSVGHNTNIAAKNNASFNQTVPAGSELEHKFTETERRPATVGCNIHPWMTGWVLPQDTPYFAVSGKDGEFEIKDLPSGTWTFQVWHEKARSIGNIEVNGKAAKWSKGRVDVTITADAITDFGDIKFSEDLFQ